MSNINEASFIDIINSYDSIAEKYATPYSLLYKISKEGSGIDEVGDVKKCLLNMKKKIQLLKNKELTKININSQYSETEVKEFCEKIARFTCSDNYYSSKRELYENLVTYVGKLIVTTEVLTGNYKEISKVQYAPDGVLVSSTVYIYADIGYYYSKIANGEIEVYDGDGIATGKKWDTDHWDSDNLYYITIQDENNFLLYNNYGKRTDMYGRAYDLIQMFVECLKIESVEDSTKYIKKCLNHEAYKKELCFYREENKEDTFKVEATNKFANYFMPVSYQKLDGSAGTINNAFIQNFSSYNNEYFTSEFTVVDQKLKITDIKFLDYYSKLLKEENEIKELENGETVSDNEITQRKCVVRPVFKERNSDIITLEKEHTATITKENNYCLITLNRTTIKEALNGKEGYLIIDKVNLKLRDNWIGNLQLHDDIVEKDYYTAKDWYSTFDDREISIWSKVNEVNSTTFTYRYTYEFTLEENCQFNDFTNNYFISNYFMKQGGAPSYINFTNDDIKIKPIITTNMNFTNSNVTNDFKYTIQSTKRLYGLDKIVLKKYGDSSDEKCYLFKVKKLLETSI